MGVLFTGEQITVENLELLTDSDLKDLGFAMGHRRMLLAWNAGQQAQRDGVEVASATAQRSPSSSAASSSPVPDAGHTPRPAYRVSQDTRAVCFKVMCSDIFLQNLQSP